MSETFKIYVSREKAEKFQKRKNENEMKGQFLINSLFVIARKSNIFQILI